ncbi:MAG: FG-GAP repeat protein [Planctomycetota bacterium]
MLPRIALPVRAAGPAALLALAALTSPAGAQGSCQEALVAASNPSLEARFGFSVAVDGDTVAVGAPFGNGAATLSGVVYVYERGPAGWIETAKLSAGDGAPGDGFGNELALDGDRLLIGSVWKDGPGVDSGAAYLFERGPGGWAEAQKLLPSDHAPQDWYGRAVALDGDRLLVGASLKADPAFATGATYVYERSGGTWNQTAKLSASDGAGDDFFGGSLDLDGDRILVGAHGADDLAEESGGAYVFDLVGGTWVETVKLIAADGKANDDLAVEVALAGDVALLASFGDDEAGPDAGSVYVFELGPGGWAETDELTASDADAADGFGSGLALDGDLAVVGAWYDDDGATDAGAAYVFSRAGGSFAEVAKIAGATTGGFAGFDVAVSGTTVVSGAPEAASPLPFAGEVGLHGVDPGGSFAACPPWLSLAAGGAQTLRVEAGAGFASQLYFVAGSASGTAPGFLYQGVAVPLNPDFYFLFGVSHPGAAPLGGSFGPLDGAGSASASFALPAGFDPTLAGTKLHHAALLLDPLQLTALASTEAEPLALVP